MKKRIVAILGVLLIGMMNLAGCGKTETAQPATEETTAQVQEQEEAQEQAQEQEQVTIGNPWVDSDVETISDSLGLWMKIIDGATNVQCQLNETEKLSQMTFTYGEIPLDYTFRMKKTDGFEDISGEYYEWTVEDEGEMLGCECHNRRYIDDDITVDSIMWYEQATGTMYSLSTSAKDLDGFDIQATAQLIYGDEPLGDYPSNGFEERVGRTEFESYDEIISLLNKDEAYALVNIKGYDGEVLLITEYTYDNLDGNMVTIEATPYTMKSTGKVTADGAMYSGGTANPLAIDDDGVVYCATHSTMEKQCYGTNGTDDVAVMNLEYIYIEEYDEEGMPASVGGFIRTENTVIDNNGVDIASDDVDAFTKAFEDYANTHVIGFTVVK